METISDSKNIKSFISNIVDKNYKDANESLHKMVEDKLKERIKHTAFTKKTSNLDK
jgi:hypothetical protein